ncbi:MAG: GTP pyrophosphokinase family protein [Defluviitaleaceae bacterium]|nr:GTP pyrophosphokinase family protein [Defluviitaleaceae bacterium]
MAVLFSNDEFAKLKEHLVLYRCALINMTTRMEILLEDFSNLQDSNPIEHVKYRLKSPESIASKLHRQSLDLTADSAKKHLADIAGVRVICPYTKDISYIAKVLKSQSDLKVLSEKDYITNPKPSGYRSYHLIFEVPIYLSNTEERLPVEVQIRTQAMDFWATLEHKARYKYQDDMPGHLAHELNECAIKISELDDRMSLIQDIVNIAYD